MVWRHQTPQQLAKRAAYLDTLIRQDPDGEWILITDQLNTLQSEEVVRWVARLCKLEDGLGEKGKSGVLATMKSRADFLSNRSHRIRFVYTPKHSSWLNQIEIWFSILMRRLLKRGNFTSKDDLKSKILRFIDYFNQTMANLFDRPILAPELSFLYVVRTFFRVFERDLLEPLLSQIVELVVG